MKRKTLIFFTILIVSITSIAEKNTNQKLAELEKRLQKVYGKEKIDVLNELAYEYYSISPKKNLEYGNQALELSKELKYKKGEVKALKNIGIGYWVKGDYDKALEYYKNSLKISEKIGDKKGISDSLQCIGLVYYNLSKYDKALEYYKNSLKISEKIGYKKGIAYSFNYIGAINCNLGKYDKALEYYLKSLTIYEKIGSNSRIANSLNNIGVTYDYLGDFDKALEYHSKALKIREEIGSKLGIATSLGNIGLAYFNLNNFDKALKYYQDSLRISEKIGDKTGVAYSLNFIGFVYVRSNNFKKAIKYYQKSLKKYEEIRDKTGITTSLIGIGEVYTKLKKYDEALKTLKRGLKISDEIKAKELIRGCYEGLFSLFKSKGDYKKALDYLEKYIEIKDKIFNERSRKQINELQVRYEAEKREKEIEILKKGNDIKELRLKSQRLIRNGFIIGFVLLFIILFLLFRKYLYFFSFWKRLKYVGQYRLVEKIGSGAMGTIFKAHSLMNKNETAALKIMKQELFVDEINRKRFKQEATIIDKLNHPNIIRIIERGEFKESLFIAMELLEGKTLESKIKEEAPLNLDECIHIMIQISDAFVLIHSKNIIHRDLKPANIMLVKKNGDLNFVKLLDFGLAKMEFQTRLTQSGNFVGTIEYVSPELILNSECSHLSDIFALGVTFYHMLCGQTPFPGENVIDIMGGILNKKPVRVSEFRPDIPEALNDLVLKMIDKRPKKRPSAEMVLNTLNSVSSS